MTAARWFAGLYGWQGPTEGPTDLAHVGKTRSALDEELREVGGETRKRTTNRVDVEDQAARVANLHEARARLN